MSFQIFYVENKEVLVSFWTSVTIYFFIIIYNKKVVHLYKYWLGFPEPSQSHIQMLKSSMTKGIKRQAYLFTGFN